MKCFVSGRLLLALSCNYHALDLRLDGKRAMVVHVASFPASATTGAALRVDGGTVKRAF